MWKGNTDFQQNQFQNMQFSYKIPCFVNVDNYSLSCIRHSWRLDAHSRTELKHSAQSVVLHLEFSAQRSCKSPLLGCDELPQNCLSNELHSILCCFILLSVASPVWVPSVGWEECHLQGMPQWKVAQGHQGWGLPSHTEPEHSNKLTDRLGGNLGINPGNLLWVLQILKETPQIWRYWDALGCIEVRLTHGSGTDELRLRDVTDATDVGPGIQRDAGSVLLPLWSLSQPFTIGLCYGWYHKNTGNWMVSWWFVHSECSHLSIQDPNPSLRRDLRDILQFFKDVPPHLATCRSPEMHITARHGKFVW